jgi:carboxyl-terminal processing protease
MIRRTSLALVAALLVAPLALGKPDRPSQLEPLPDQGKTAAFTMYTLSRVHYRSVPLDDTLSTQIYEAYLESIDPEKLFYLAGDIAEFSAWERQMDDAIRNQELEAPFTMFNRYVERVRERSDHARALLQQGFDFTVDEDYVYDREDAQWAGDAAELDELWRKRVKNDWLRLKLAGKKDADIVDTLDKRYQRFQERIEEIDSEDVFQTFLNAYASAIEPHTNYLAPRTADAFEIQMSLSLEGIGAVLQREDEHTVIRSVVSGGPADRIGLKPGDRVLAVGQADGPMVDVIGWRIDDTVKLIRGPKDSTVRIDVVPAEASIDSKPNRVSIVRQKVKLEEQAAKKRVIEVGEGDAMRRIGVIELDTFYQDFEARRRGEADFRSATRDVARLLEELKADGVDGVVLDLRNNGGGSLDEATELTGLFIDQGPVVQVRNAQGRVDIGKDKRPGRVWDGPLAVMVNRVSASASEIFAAAIQDYGRGLVIGEPTYGKGTVQNLVSLDQLSGRDDERHGQLKFTTAQFFRINGGSTQLKGVTPDIQFPASLLDPEDFGEGVYDNALPWVQIDPVQYEPIANLGPLLGPLEARHKARIAGDMEYRFWQEDLADYRQQRERRSVSLLESERRAERDRQEARRKAREQARAELGVTKPGQSATARSDDGLQADERSVAEVAAEEARARKEDRPDVLMTEAARILADAISLGNEELRLAGLPPLPAQGGAAPVE